MGRISGYLQDLQEVRTFRQIEEEYWFKRNGNKVAGWIGGKNLADPPVPSSQGARVVAP